MSPKWHRKVAGLFGYELIKRRKLNDTPDQHLENLLNLLGINCVIDVGANTGGFGQMLRANSYAGRIVSFEPLQVTFSDLQENSYEDENWHVHQLALGRESGTSKIFRCTETAFSSFRAPNDYGKERFKWRIGVDEREFVQVSTLESVWPEVIRGITEPRVFLKIDTQGFDLEVLGGAERYLDSILGIQSELSLQPIYEDMPNYLDALTEFRANGFHITGFYPVTRDKGSLAVIEYDCFMQRMV